MSTDFAIIMRNLIIICNPKYHIIAQAFKNVYINSNCNSIIDFGSFADSLISFKTEGLKINCQ